MIHKVIAKTSFHFNPFCGVLDEDLNKIIESRFDLNQLAERITMASNLAVEFIGKKGRGKTTHLRALYQITENASLYLLKAKSNVERILNDPSQIVFVDSLHYLSFKDRIRIFKHKKVVIYTTHQPRTIGCILAKKPKESFMFSGIDHQFLNKIILNRLSLAAANFHTVKNPYSKNDIDVLIKQFGDDYRAIIHHLYDNFND